MIVWRVTGNEIGPNGCGAMFFATKAEATQHAREWFGEQDDDGPPPVAEKIVIRNATRLAIELNDAMGYGVT